jgi:hypothetical protein
MILALKDRTYRHWKKPCGQKMLAGTRLGNSGLGYLFCQLLGLFVHLLMQQQLLGN